tara:strand:+ start:452 stop:646 length:195 start_codon:yes stop_codon:yes gene_type:complete
MFLGFVSSITVLELKSTGGAWSVKISSSSTGGAWSSFTNGAWLKTMGDDLFSVEKTSKFANLAK